MFRETCQEEAAIMNRKPRTATASHTPGPWRTVITKPTRREPRGTAMVATTQGIMAIDVSLSGQTPLEDIANANLIAAAPDLLDLARNVAGLSEAFLISGDARVLRGLIRKYREQARAVIDQATGAK